MPNAFKYSLSMSVTCFGAFHSSFSQSQDWSAFRILWIFFYFASTIYSWSWDVFMDWSAVDFNNSDLLRQRRMLSNRNVYYLAIVSDLVLRFFWTYTLIPGTENIFDVSVGLVLSPFAAVAEILRRTMWSVLRLENEHLNNTSGYRKITHIPLHFDAPSHSVKVNDDQANASKRLVFIEVSIYVSVVVVVISLAVIFRES